MRRYLGAIVLLFIALLLPQSLWGDSLYVRVDIQHDGSALISEVWDMSSGVYEGTEMYLVRTNLGDIELGDFRVSDESGPYSYIGRWDVSRTLSQKAGKCGIVKRKDGMELCWGLGSYGPHTYTVSYTMSNVVKSLRDYDSFHMQLVSPGIKMVPSNVSVEICVSGTPIGEDNCRIWGFGYRGDIVFSQGRVLAHSSDFDSSSSVIVLIRLDKGIVESSSIQDEDFASVLGRARVGASWADDEDDTDRSGLLGIIIFVIGAVGAIWAAVHHARRRREQITGHKRLRDIGWVRDVPFDGDILESNYVLNQLGASSGSAAVASAMILRMIQRGYIEVAKNPDHPKRVDLHFVPQADLDSLSESYRELYDMLMEAAGSDVILQDREFSRWTDARNANKKRVDEWIETVEQEGRDSLVEGGYMSLSGSWKESVKPQGAAVIGFRKFLKDFTLLQARASQEVAVWNDYLTYGALYGIADKVARELSDINPQVFEQTLFEDPATAYYTILMIDRVSTSITLASTAVREAAQKAASGYGGGASFGGGGGFSGGGFGGGVR